MEDKSPASRIEAFDILRGLAIIGVVAIHVTARSFELESYGSLEYYFLVLVSQVSRFCVPAFLILSGFFLSYRADRSDPSENASQPTRALRKRLVKVIPPYVFWSLFFYFFYAISGQESFDWLSLVEKILTGSVIVPYYFVVVIIQLYLMWWVVVKLGLSYRRVLLPLLAIQVFFVANFYLSFMGHVSRIPWSISWMFGWSGYFVLGLIWGQKRRLFDAFIDRHKVAIVVGTVLAFCGSVLEFHFIYTRFNDMIAAQSAWKISSSLFAILMVSSISLVRKSVPVLNALAHHSFGIYLIHMPFVSKTTHRVAALFNDNQFLALPVSLTAGVLLSYLAVHLASKVYDAGIRPLLCACTRWRGHWSCVQGAHSIVGPTIAEVDRPDGYAGETRTR